MSTRRSCSWCDQENDQSLRYCTRCFHRAHLPRSECDCPACVSVVGKTMPEILAQLGAKDFKIEMAPTEEMDGVSEEAIDRVLTVLGHPEAMVTDMSTVGDFATTFGALEEMETFGDACRTLADISEELGMEVGMSDRIVDVAMKLEKPN